MQSGVVGGAEVVDDPRGVGEGDVSEADEAFEAEKVAVLTGGGVQVSLEDRAVEGAFAAAGELVVGLHRVGRRGAFGDGEEARSVADAVPVAGA
jgi:hypothetical protein